MVFAAVLYFAAGVVGCWCHVSAKEVIMAVDVWKFSNNPPNSASVTDAITFLVML